MWGLVLAIIGMKLINEQRNGLKTMGQGKQQINVGIIGYGFSATTFHIPFFQGLAEYELKKIVSRQGADPALKGVEFTPNLDAVLQDPDIDLIVVTTPSHLHYEHAKAALENNKHVVVEKPFVLEESQGQELISLAKQQNKLLTVYHNRRWDSDFLTIRHLLNTKVLGDVTFFEARFDRFRPIVKDRWKESDLPGAGVVWDLGCHLVDQAVQLFGRPEDVISDVALQRVGAKSPDYFQIIMKYKQGLRVVLGSNSLCLSHGPKFQVHGTKGSFVKYGADPQEHTLFNTKRFLEDDCWGQESVDIHGQLSLWENDQVVCQTIPSVKGIYQEFYKSLAHSILSGIILPPVNPQDALYTTHILQNLK